MRKLALEVVDKDLNKVGVSNHALLGVATKYECKVCISCFIFLQWFHPLCDNLIRKAVNSTALALGTVFSAFTFLFAWIVVLTTACKES